MDEQEVPENSSEEISKDQLRESDGIAPSSSAADDTGSESGAGQGNSNSEPDTDEINFALAPEELPTMQWSDVYAELAEFERLERDGPQEDTAPVPAQQQPAQTGPLTGLEDAMSWLEELAAGQGMPIDEMPTLVTAQPVEDQQSPEKVSVPDDPPDDEVVIPALELDSDPMAWLEQLAVDQSSPLEELPSVADRLLASEIVSQTEIPPNSTINDPYDVDQALGYLEQLAVAQGVDLTGVSFDVEQPLNSLNAALAIIDGLALTGLAASAVVPDPDIPAGEIDIIPASPEELVVEDLPQPDHWSDLPAGMPEDPQQALDWLSNVEDEGDVSGVEVVEEAETAGTPIIIPSPDTVEVEPQSATLEPETVESPIDAEVLEEMPEDPDEAVAWMEHLAAHGSQSQTAETAAPPSQQEQEPPSSSESSGGQQGLLLEAQAALDGGDLAGALVIYQTLLDDDAASDELLKALEDAVANHQDLPGLLRMLGDAYMQMGEVDKAISTYRRGFDHL